MAELRSQVGQLRITDEANLSFEEVAARWMVATQHTLKASSIKRRQTCIQNLAPYFPGLTIRNIQPQHCEHWLTDRAANIAPQTMVHELNTMLAVFEYAINLGLILSNPAKHIKRKKVVQALIVIPTREQFKRLIEAIRESDGREDSQKKAKPSADLVELLAYSDCRQAEGTSIRWRDVDFEQNTLRITGGDVGTKNNEHRMIPMTEALLSLLMRLRDARKPKPEDFVSQIDSAKKCLATACRRLSPPIYSS